MKDEVVRVSYAEPVQNGGRHVQEADQVVGDGSVRVRVDRGRQEKRLTDAFA